MRQIHGQERNAPLKQTFFGNGQFFGVVLDFSGIVHPNRIFFLYWGMIKIKTGL